MHTKDTAVTTMIRSWAGTTECDNYKDMAAEMADAIRERAMYLEDAAEFGRQATPAEASAIGGGKEPHALRVQRATGMVGVVQRSRPTHCLMVHHKQNGETYEHRS